MFYFDERGQKNNKNKLCGEKEGERPRGFTRIPYSVHIIRVQPSGYDPASGIKISVQRPCNGYARKNFCDKCLIFDQFCLNF